VAVVIGVKSGIYKPHHSKARPAVRMVGASRQAALLAAGWAGCSWDQAHIGSSLGAGHVQSADQKQMAGPAQELHLL
jgi:hypothetical protein